MGGLGSGGSNRRHRGCVEQHRRLEVSRFAAYLASGEAWEGSCAWVGPDGNRNSIRVSGDRSAVRLKFAARVGNGELQSVDQVVWFERIPKHLGGFEYYFGCPRCGTRCKNLFGAQAEFLCRACSGLTHSSSRERHSDRATRQARRIRRRLGAGLGMDDPAPRPKNMHLKTYQRLHSRLEQKEAESWDDMLLLLQRLQKSTARTSARRSRTPSHGRRRSAFW